MHTITEREFSFDLTNNEIIALAQQIIERNILPENFTGFRIEVEDLQEIQDDDGISVGGYGLLRLCCESKISNNVLGTPHAEETILVDKASDSAEGIRSLIDRGSELVEMLKSAMPDTSIRTVYPKEFQSVKDPKPLPADGPSEKAAAKDSSAQSIKFLDRNHVDFYMDAATKVKAARKIEKLDSYQKALIYTLGLLDDCRKHFDEIFNVAENHINPDVLQAGWQTSGSIHLILFAFNLWNEFVPEDFPATVSVSHGFGENPRLMPYLFEAVKLRFPPNNEPEYDVLDENGNVICARASLDFAQMHVASTPGYFLSPSEDLSAEV